MPAMTHPRGQDFVTNLAALFPQQKLKLSLIINRLADIILAVIAAKDIIMAR